MIMVSERNECEEGGVASPPPNTERWHPSTEEGGVASPPPNTERWHPPTEEIGVAIPHINTDDRPKLSVIGGGTAIPSLDTERKPTTIVNEGRDAIPSLDTLSRHTPTVIEGRAAIPSLDTERRDDESMENPQENRVIMSKQLGNENGYLFYNFKEENTLFSQTAPNENKESFQSITKKDKALSKCLKKENNLFSQTTINEDDVSYQTTQKEKIMNSQSLEKIIEVSSKQHKDSQITGTNLLSTSQFKDLTPTSVGTVLF